MSGRIYDKCSNPICDKCGSRMWKSSDTNFNGVRCKRNGCGGQSDNNEFNIKPNGKYVLEGVLTHFNTTKSKYTLIERLENSIFTLKRMIEYKSNRLILKIINRWGK